jgi:hypothetical protein
MRRLITKVAPLLVIALAAAGTAYATQGNPGPTGPPGREGVVARARSTGPITAEACPSEKNYPLSNGSWIQAADESDEIIGQLTWTADHAASGTADVGLDVRVNGILFGVGFTAISGTQGETQTVTFTLSSAPRTSFATGGPASTAWLFEPGKRSRNVVTVDVCTQLGNPSETIHQLALNVIGFR